MSYRIADVDVPNLLNGLKSAATVRAYGIHWGEYIKFAGRYGDPQDPGTLIGWRNHLVNNTKESPNTINLRLASVKSVFRELAAAKHIPKEVYWAINEVKKLPPNALASRRSKTARVRIEPETVRKMVEAPPINLGDPVGARNRALLLVFATSGLRRSEVCRIKVEDVRQIGNNYAIVNVWGKGAAQARVAPLTKEAYLAIQDWLHIRPTHSEWLFTSLSFDVEGDVLYSPNPMSGDSAYYTVKKYAAEIGMGEIKPHDLRRFVGTQLAKRDIRVAQKVLGHANINTTAKHYVLDDVPLDSTEGLF